MNDEFSLLPYQLTGAGFLAGRKFALLADDMGLGKSAQAIVASNMCDARRILVLCPAIARINWQREFDRFSLYGLPIHIMFARSDRPASFGVTICSYDIAATGVFQVGLGRGKVGPSSVAVPDWDILICDEAHYLQSMTTLRTKAVFGKKGLVHKAAQTWLLTGTPMTNHPGNLWPMMFVGGFTTLTASAFIERFCQTRRTHFGLKIEGAKHSAIPELRAILAKFMLRRKKADVLTQLPPITYKTIALPPGHVDLEVAMYEAWRRAGGNSRLMTVINNQEASVANALRLLSKSNMPLRDMLPIVSGLEKSVSELRVYTGMAKVPGVVELLTAELESGQLDKIVLFAVHKSVIESLRDAFRKYKAVTIYGGTPGEKRQANIDKFMHNPKCRVIICNIVACGTAVTLTAACEALFIEQDWVAANNAQAAMRIHRIGQTRKVRIRYAVMANSTDERIAEALRRKTRDELAIFS